MTNEQKEQKKANLKQRFKRGELSFQQYHNALVPLFDKN